MRRHVKALVAVVIAMLCLGASAAFALQTHTPGTPFDGSQVPNGSFGALGGVAVDQSGGDVYVLDTTGAPDSTGAIQRFSSGGAFLSQISGIATASGFLSAYSESDVAIDSSGTSSDGTAYVTDSFSNLIVAFDTESGTLETAFDGDGELTGSATPPASFSIPCGLAIDQSNGNLFVADQGNNRVWIYDNAGNYLGRVADSSLNGPCGIALTSIGDLFVRNANDGKVLRFNRVAATDYGFAGTFYAPDNSTPSEFGDDGPFATDVAVNTAGDHLYLDKGDRITEYDAGGSVISTFGQGTLAESRGIALNPASGRVLASDGAELETFGALITVADVTTGQVQGVTATTATLTGSLDPAGPATTACFFEWGTDASYGNTAPCSEGDAFTAPASVNAEISGLSAGTEYRYRLVVENSAGPSAGDDRGFVSDGAPVVSGVAALDVRPATATLRARINPAGSETDYHFEYVEKSEFEATGFDVATSVPVPDASIPAGSSEVLVHQVATGLSPETSYRLRAVASNEAASTPSSVSLFHTGAAPAPPSQDSCANAKERAAVGSQHLPDCRAWEMVSPPDKNGNDVLTDTSHTHAAVDCSTDCAVKFSSFGAFGKVEGMGTVANYISERTRTPETNGWEVHDVTPRQEPFTPAGAASVMSPIYTGDFSPDLDQAVYRSFLPLTDAPNVNEVSNLYLRTNLRSGQPITRLLTDAVTHIPAQSFGFRRPRLAGQSTDFSHITFQSRQNLTADATGFGEKLYENAAGDVTLVGRIPTAGTECDDQQGPACTSADVTSQAGLNDEVPHYTYNTISDDGSRIFFQSPVGEAGGKLYVREDGSRTTQLNVSEKATPDAPQTARLWTASSDGSQAFLTTAESLVEADTNETTDLYRYSISPDVDGDHLTLISVDENSADGVNVTGVVGVSDDGSYVYFTARGQLVASEPALGDDTFAGTGLYVWHQGQLAFVGAFSHGENVVVNTLLANATNSNTLQSRLTPDGRHLLFVAEGDKGFRGRGGFAGYDHGNCDAFSGCREYYVYDAEEQRLACASCNPSGEPSTLDTRTDLYALALVVAPGSHMPHVLSDDGRYVFFSTPEKLVPADRNGPCSLPPVTLVELPSCTDAYQYDTETEKVSLLSSGESSSTSFIADVSSDGSDVFFMTRERLSGWDIDTEFDLYDARIGGGLPEPSPPPAVCIGDACQPPPIPLNDATPSSSSFSGAGNQVNPHRRKHRRKSKKQRHKQRKATAASRRTAR